MAVSSDVIKEFQNVLGDLCQSKYNLVWFNYNKALPSFLRMSNMPYKDVDVSPILCLN